MAVDSVVVAVTTLGVVTWVVKDVVVAAVVVLVESPASLVESPAKDSDTIFPGLPDRALCMVVVAAFVVGEVADKVLAVLAPARGVSVVEEVGVVVVWL